MTTTSISRGSSRGSSFRCNNNSNSNSNNNNNNNNNNQNGLTIKTSIQVIAILLLLCAISLQLNMRNHHRRHASMTATRKDMVQPKMLQDFFLQSAELETKKQESQLHSTANKQEQQHDINSNSTTHLRLKDSNNNPILINDAGNSFIDDNNAEPGFAANASPNEIIIPNITQLGCIDMVRKCMKFKAEARPSLEKSKVAFNLSVVALAEPVLKGGYRNQYMRFVALVATALTNGQAILLPSVKWHEKSSHNGIPFDMIWNVSVWNNHASSHEDTLLPQLVDYHGVEHRQWNIRTTAFRGTCPSIISWFASPHRISLAAEVKEMTMPHSAGGARSGQPGNLWDYYRSRDKYGLQIELVNGRSISLAVLEEWIQSALQPTDIIQSLVRSLRPSSPYMALHPRIEPEMLDHRFCQDDKERNLRKIMSMVERHEDFESYSQLFVAVAMPQMVKSIKGNPKWAKDHVENLQLLQDMFLHGYTRTNDSSRHLHVWTAGEGALEERHVNQCMITLLASIVNLELAIQANIFIGTTVSTWSTSVWKARYWRHGPERANNYVFTPNEGIQKLNGLPKPFRC